MSNNDNNGNDNEEDIDTEDIVVVDSDPKPDPKVDFEQMADELRELMTLMKSASEEEFDPSDEEVVENVIDLFTKAKIKSDEKLIELEKREKVQELLFDLKRLEPTDIIIIGLVPVAGQPEHMKRLVTLSTLKTVQEVNHILDSAKSRLL